MSIFLWICSWKNVFAPEISLKMSIKCKQAYKLFLNDIVLFITLVWLIQQFFYDLSHFNFEVTRILIVKRSLYGLLYLNSFMQKYALLHLFVPDFLQKFPTAFVDIWVIFSWKMLNWLILFTMNIIFNIKLVYCKCYLHEMHGTWTSNNLK